MNEKRINLEKTTSSVLSAFFLLIYVYLFISLSNLFFFCLDLLLIILSIFFKSNFNHIIDLHSTLVYLDGRGDSMLDAACDLLSMDLRPVPPQPNCPQSMKIYEDHRFVTINQSSLNKLSSVHENICICYN